MGLVWELGMKQSAALWHGGLMVSIATPSVDQAMVFWTDLTPQERQVGEAMAEGCMNSKIADRLHWSIRTIETRISAIYEKLPDIPDVHRRVHAVLLIRRVLG